nr:roadblock/LC7 domain-containing protein [Nocardia farcinica]
MLYAAEAMSKANALAATLADGGPPAVPVEELLYQIGFYHTEIGLLAADIDNEQREAAAALTRSPAWQQVTAMENAVLRRVAGADTADPPMDTEQWQSAAAEVNRGLLDLWIAQNKRTQRLAEETSGDSALGSLYGGMGVMLVSVAAFLIAVVLANRIIRRLKRLRGETLALADERLPAMLRRLRAGESVDPAAETPRLDYGRDEIGQVARAFEHAHAAAVTAAVDEARTREGVKAVFLNIAHRSQIVVHRQLEILDEAESRQEDPQLLETLFRLDHLATRERRNAENLIVLGGGMPGRQWRHPIPLLDLVRAAVGETLDYARVHVHRIPDTHVLGSVVADLGHLLAELVDNAIAFSPPQSRVELSGAVVGRGVVVEVSDQGMGMSEEELARVNEMLREPPDFGVARLSADSRLGLFVVAQLAVRHGVSVRLSESPYGGVRAVVLIPSVLLAAEPPAPRPAEYPLRQRYSAVPDEPAGDRADTAVATLAQPAPVRAPAAAFTPDGRPQLPRRRRQAPRAAESPATPAPAAPRPRTFPRTGPRSDVGHREWNPAGPPRAARRWTGRRTVSTAKSGDLDWLLDDLVDRLAGVRHAVVLSTDGLLLGRSKAIERDDAEHFAAMSSTLYGLARSAGSRFDGGGVRQAVIELDRAVLFVTSAGDNACLALQAAENANLGMVAYEMNVTVQRVGSYLSTPARLS